MRALVLSSGGKDSSLALWWSICQGWTISSVVTVSIKGEDSWMFQIPGTKLAELQCKDMDLQHQMITVSGEGEVEVEELLEGLRPLIEAHSIDALVCGALRSEYQRRRIDRICEELAIHSFSPLWHHDAERHMHELLECGMEMWMVSVSCDGLDEDWLGRKLDIEAFDELSKLSSKFRFSIDGEGGEFETIITSGPHMNGRIVFEAGHQWSGNRGHLNITAMKLE